MKYLQRGDIDRLDKWLNSGGSANSVEKQGYSLVTSAIMNETPAGLELLLKRGANANLVDELGIRPISLASVRRGPYLGLLLAAGADPGGRQRPYRYTPPIIAIRSGILENVIRLLDAGADANEPDAQGITPIAYAEEASSSEIIEELRRPRIKKN